MARTIRRALVLGLLLTAGCAKKQRVEDFVPADETARALLETALNAWKAGKEPGVMQDSGPRINLFDSHHKPKQRLADFVVLGSTAGEFERCYAVRLKFAEPAEEVRARYYVVGSAVGPVSVYRHEDFVMIMHWDHGPPADNAKNPVAPSQ